MSLLDRLPTRRPRPIRKHRADDRIAELTAEVQHLREWQDAADDFFEQQDRNLTALEGELAAEKRARAAAEAEAEARGRWVADLERQLAEANRRLDVGVKAEHVVAKTQELDPDEVRRICAQPMPLHEAREAGLLGPVTHPGHIH